MPTEPSITFLCNKIFSVILYNFELFSGKFAQDKTTNNMAVITINA